MYSILAKNILLRDKDNKNEALGIVRKALSRMLKTTPGNRFATFNLAENPAYCLVEAVDGWIEERVFGVRINEHNVLEVSTALDDDGAPSWEDGDVIGEHDHYVLINWISVLRSIFDDCEPDWVPASNLITHMFSVPYGTKLLIKTENKEQEVYFGGYQTCTKTTLDAHGILAVFKLPKKDGTMGNQDWVYPVNIAVLNTWQMKVLS